MSNINTNYLKWSAEEEEYLEIPANKRQSLEKSLSNATTVASNQIALPEGKLLFDLPLELICHIFSFFNNYEFLSLRYLLVNRKFIDLVNSPLMQQKLAARFGFPNQRLTEDAIIERRDWFETSIKLERKFLNHMVQFLSPLRKVKFKNPNVGFVDAIKMLSEELISKKHEANKGFLHAYKPFRENDLILKGDWEGTRFVYEEWMLNTEVYLAHAIKNNRKIDIKSAAVTIKNSKFIALILLGKTHKNSQYEHFSVGVQSDEEVVRAQIQANPEKFLNLLFDKKIVLEVDLLKKILIAHPEFYERFPKEIMSDELKVYVDQCAQYRKEPERLRSLRCDITEHEVILRKKAIEDYKNLEFFSSEARDNEILMALAIQHNPLAYQYLSDRLKLRVDMIEAALSKSAEVFQWIPEKAQNDLTICKCYFTHHFAKQKNQREPSNELTGRFADLRTNQEFMRFYVSTRSERYMLVYNQFKRDQSLAAYAEFLHDKAVILKHADMIGEFIFKKLPKAIIDEEIAIECVKSLKALSFALSEYQDNVRVVHSAVSHHGIDFKYASDRLRGDIDILKVAFDKNVNALFFATENVVNQPEYPDLLRVALSSPSAVFHAFHLVPEKYKLDRQYALIAAHTPQLQVITFVEAYADDKEIVELEIKKNPLNYCHVSPRLRDDIDVFKKALASAAAKGGFAHDINTIVSRTSVRLRLLYNLIWS